jgi:DNA recombination protein RmuC
MDIAIYIVVGLVAGALAVGVITWLNRRGMEKTFTAISRDTLKWQAEMGNTDLEEKKKLIDNTLEMMKTDLGKVEKLLAESAEKREKSFSEINTQLKNAATQTTRLQETTGKLSEALASSKVRGQWGERMAEDVLQAAGFHEGYNYLKQKTQDTVATRPDFTFLLPGGLRLNMDVKFPLDNYLKYCDAANDDDRKRYREKFLADTRQMIKQVKSREYINPAENTVDYMLLFIPNEQLFYFLNEADSHIIDEAIRDKVVLCSPVTLFAVLAVIRQAIDNFQMEKTAAEILALLASFNKQWQKYRDGMDKMGASLDKAVSEYQKLVTTRTRALERPLQQIEELKDRRGLAAGGNPETVELSLEPPADEEK